MHLNFLLVWIWSVLDPFNQFRFQILPLFAQFGNALRIEKLRRRKPLKIPGQISLVHVRHGFHFTLINKPPFWIERTRFASRSDACYIDSSARSSLISKVNLALCHCGLRLLAFYGSCGWLCFLPGLFGRSFLRHERTPFRLPFPCSRASLDATIRCTGLRIYAYRKFSTSMICDCCHPG